MSAGHVIKLPIANESNTEGSISGSKKNKKKFIAFYTHTVPDFFKY